MNLLLGTMGLERRIAVGFDGSGFAEVQPGAGAQDRVAAQPPTGAEQAVPEGRMASSVAAGPQPWRGTVVTYAWRVQLVDEHVQGDDDRQWTEWRTTRNAAASEIVTDADGRITT